MLVAATAMAFVLPIVALASEFGSGPTFSLPAANTVSGNLYASGGTVNVLGMVTKDLMVAGGSVMVSGPVAANVMAAGGNVSLTGEVGQDLRLAGGSVTINSIVRGELLAAAGTLSVGEQTRVSGDAYLAGGQITIDGIIDGVTRITAENVVINGTINRDVLIKARKVTVGPQAVINGNFSYQSPVQAEISTGARIAGQTNFQRLETAQRGAGSMVWAWLIKLISVAVSAIVLYFLFRRGTTELAVRTANSFWFELLRGLIILVVTPILVLLLLVSIVGWVLALVALFAYLLMIFSAAILSVLTTTGLLQKYAFRTDPAVITWPKILLGALALLVLSLIPYVGWIICFGIFLSAFGALGKIVYHKIHS